MRIAAGRSAPRNDKMKGELVMPIETPPVRTGDLKTDFDRLWEWAWHLAETLRLREEEQNGIPKT